MHLSLRFYPFKRKICIFHDKNLSVWQPVPDDEWNINMPSRCGHSYNWLICYAIIERCRRDDARYGNGWFRGRYPAKPSLCWWLCNQIVQNALNRICTVCARISVQPALGILLKTFCGQWPEIGDLWQSIERALDVHGTMCWPAFSEKQLLINLRNHLSITEALRASLELSFQVRRHRIVPITIVAAYRFLQQKTQRFFDLIQGLSKREKILTLIWWDIQNSKKNDQLEP